MRKMLLVTLVVLALFASIGFAGVSITNYTISKSTYAPGEPGVASLTVANPTGSSNVRGLTMNINSPPELAISSTPNLADITGGGSTIVTIPFRVKDDARPGIYMISVNFNGFTSESSTGTTLSNPVTNSISIPVTIVKTPIFFFTSDKKVLEGIDALKIQIQNNGGLAKDVTLKTNGTITMLGGSAIFLGEIRDSKDVGVTLDSRSASDGPNDLNITLTYKDEIGTETTSTYAIRMTVKKEKLDIAFRQMSDLITKKEGPLTLSIKNNGNTTLTDVRLTFSDSAISVSDRNELAYGDIASGATKEVTRQIRAELPPGLNHVAAKVTWVEKDVTKEQNIDVPLTITSDADVGVYLEAKPTPLMSGSEHTVSVLVSNMGSYPIDNVQVKFASDTLKSVDISNNQYIGSLNSDDFSTVQFKIKVANVPEGSYPSDVIVSYHDRSGEWKTKTISENIYVYMPAQNGNGWIVIIPTLAVIGVLVWYFKFRKEQEQKQV